MISPEYFDRFTASNNEASMPKPGQYIQPGFPANGVSHQRIAANGLKPMPIVEEQVIATNGFKPKPVPEDQVVQIPEEKAIEEDVSMISERIDNRQRQFSASQQTMPLLPAESSGFRTRTPEKQVEYVESERRMFKAPHSFMPFAPQASVSFKRKRQEMPMIKTAKFLPAHVRERLHLKSIERMHKMREKIASPSDFLQNTKILQRHKISGHKRRESDLYTRQTYPTMVEATTQFDF